MGHQGSRIGVVGLWVGVDLSGELERLGHSIYYK
jgi:hypothetical protein